MDPLVSSGIVSYAGNLFGSVPWTSRYILASSQNFVELLVELFWSVQVVLKKLFCVSVVACGINITLEHSVQISGDLTERLSQDACLEMAYHAGSSAVYCSDQKMCGSGLQINPTTSLKFLSPQECSIFTEKLDNCTVVRQELLQSGK